LVLLEPAASVESDDASDFASGVSYTEKPPKHTTRKVRQIAAFEDGRTIVSIVHLAFIRFAFFSSAGDNRSILGYSQGLNALFLGGERIWQNGDRKRLQIMPRSGFVRP